MRVAKLTESHASILRLLGPVLYIKGLKISNDWISSQAVLFTLNIKQNNSGLEIEVTRISPMQLRGSSVYIWYFNNILIYLSLNHIKQEEENKTLQFNIVICWWKCLISRKAKPVPDSDKDDVTEEDAASPAKKLKTEGDVESKKEKVKRKRKDRLAKPTIDRTVFIGNLSLDISKKVSTHFHLSCI